MLRPRVLVACAVSVAVGFGGAGVVQSWSAGAAPGAHGPVRHAAAGGADPTQRLVALTFDDGPDPRWTPQVLELLHRYGATATFFDTGVNALAHPDLVAAEIGSGNEVGDHTWSHPHLPTLSPPAIEAEIVKGAEAVRTAGAPVPVLFRPPYGASNHAVDVVARAHGYRTVGWNVAVEHFVNHTPTVAVGAEAVLDRIGPGSIILAHDGGVPDRTRTMQALPFLLEGLAARGYRVVSVGTLLAGGQGIRPAPPIAGAG